jgi:hypothetical protein
MAHLVSMIFSSVGGVRLNNVFLWTLVILALFNSTTDISQEWSAWHYFTGAKYFTELGYFELYECKIVVPTTRRNLHDYSFRRDAPNCTAKFTPDRLREFRNDSRSIGFYNQAIADKGFNSSPPFIAVARFLIDSKLITLQNFKWLDVVTLSVALVVLIRLVGWRKTAYIALFILTFYGTVDRLWGHFGQWLWLSSALVGVAMLHKKRASGGFWIGVSVSLAVFPVFLLLAYYRSKHAIGWAVVGLVFMMGVGLFSGRGVDGYIEFMHNMKLHSNYIRTELCCNIGLAHTVVSTANPESQYLKCFTDLSVCKDSYSPVFPAWAWLVLIPVVASTPLGAMFALLTLSRYYFLLLSVVVVWYGERWGRWLLVVNTFFLAWMLIEIESFFIYSDWLWVVFFLVLGVSHVRQTIKTVVDVYESGLHPKITAWYVSHKIQ